MSDGKGLYVDLSVKCDPDLKDRPGIVVACTLGTDLLLHFRRRPEHLLCELME